MSPLIYQRLVLMGHCICMAVTSLNALTFLGLGICHQPTGYLDPCDQYITSAGDLQVSTDYLRLPARNYLQITHLQIQIKPFPQVLSDLGRHIRILQKPAGYLRGQINTQNMNYIQ